MPKRKHKPDGDTSAAGTYWHNARETNVSVVHSGPLDRPDK